MSNVTDPNLINKLAEDFTSETLEDTRGITTITPPNTEVYLPGGFINRERTLVKTAEVRELTGADEELISKSTSLSALLNTVITKGLITLGDEPPLKEDFDNLLAGDRDAILLGIRKATFGDTFTTSRGCISCGEVSELEIDLDKDVPVKELGNPITDRRFSVETKAGTVVVGLPNGITQKKLLQSENKTAAELITTVLAGCIISIDGSPSLGQSTALELGIADREAIINELNKRNPGPRLGEVSKTCGACGTDISIPLSLADFFRF